MAGAQVPQKGPKFTKKIMIHRLTENTTICYLILIMIIAFIRFKYLKFIDKMIDNMYHKIAHNYHQLEKDSNRINEFNTLIKSPSF